MESHEINELIYFIGVLLGVVIVLGLICSIYVFLCL